MRIVILDDNIHRVINQTEMRRYKIRILPL